MKVSVSARTRVAMACSTSVSLLMSTSWSTTTTNFRNGSATNAAIAASLASPSCIFSGARHIDAAHGRAGDLDGILDEARADQPGQQQIVGVSDEGVLIDRVAAVG